MNIVNKMVELERAYLRTFTSCENRSWGNLYYNESQPMYFDANHAEVVETPQDPLAVVLDVEEFYKAKNLVPRLYMFGSENNQAGLINALESRGFRWEKLDSILQRWTGQLADVRADEHVTIEKVTEANLEEAIGVEVTIRELGGEIRREALLEELQIPGFTHYLLRYRGVACSTACIFHEGDQARMESVATLNEYRGKGLIGHLVRHIQQVALEKQFADLWVFPITDRVEKVYAKYGFDTIGTFSTIHAFASGKSITDIRAGK